MTEIELRHQEINAIELTPEEERYAIYAAKAKKWHRERNKDKWNDPDQKPTDEAH